MLTATSITTNALYDFPPGELRHRLVVAGERSRLEDDDRAEATRALREVIEAGRLTKAAPSKQGDEIVTRVVEQEGPIGFVESTTLGEIFDEDRNRCLLLATDESKEQTRRILLATAARDAAPPTPADARRAAVHHCLHRLLPRCGVAVPFAPAVAAQFPAGRVEARRDFRHLLQVVKASALLHHRQRDRDAAGNVVARLADYQVAERLTRGPLAASATGVGPTARAYLGALQGAFEGKEFTTTAAQVVGEGSRRSKHNYLNALSAAGLVEQVQPGKARVPAVWKLTELKIGDADATIPTLGDVSTPPTGFTSARET